MQGDELKSMKFTGNEVIVSTRPCISFPAMSDGSIQAVTSWLFRYHGGPYIPALESLILTVMDPSLWVTGAEADTPDTYFEYLFDTLCEMQMMDFGRQGYYMKMWSGSARNWEPGCAGAENPSLPVRARDIHKGTVL